jgi:hypothetical protein
MVTLRLQRELPLADPVHFRSFLDDLGVEQGARVVCIKGYGSGLPETGWHAAALDAIGDAAVIVWDGDWLKPQSFTSIIPHFLAQSDSRKAVAFRKAEGNLQGFLDSLAGSETEGQLGLALVKANDVMGAAEQCQVLGVPELKIHDTALGWLVMQASSSGIVVAVGGGATALAEATACVAKRKHGGVSPSWAVLDVGRTTLQGPEHPTELVAMAELLT